MFSAGGMGVPVRGWGLLILSLSIYGLQAVEDISDFRLVKYESLGTPSFNWQMSCFSKILIFNKFTLLKNHANRLKTLLKFSLKHYFLNRQFCFIGTTTCAVKMSFLKIIFNQKFTELMDLKGTVSVISSGPLFPRWHCAIHNGTLETFIWSKMRKILLFLIVFIF